FLLGSVDLLLQSKVLDPSRRISELNVGCDDSLRPAQQGIQLKLSEFTKTNSRADRLIKDRELAKRIKESLYDIVIGNPPWSGVLRGELSPLFDENTKALYKRTYASATDKYDIYVLFLERGLGWLIAQGRLGFITQNRFLRRGYGRGIRGVIKNKGRVQVLIDLARAGGRVFPGRSNDPCLPILQR